MSFRIEAAGLVLQHQGDELLTVLAAAFLTTTARRDDVSSSDRLDAIRALAKRTVPKAPAPADGVGPEIAKAIWLRMAKAKRRMDLIAEGRWPPAPGWANGLSDDDAPAVSSIPGDMFEAVRQGRERAATSPAPSRDWPDPSPA